MSNQILSSKLARLKFVAPGPGSATRLREAFSRVATALHLL